VRTYIINYRFRYLLKLKSVFVFMCLMISDAVYSQQTPAWLEQDQCYVCHLENEVLPESFSVNDIHMQAELSCSGCHGGDKSTDDFDQAKSAQSGFVGIPAKKNIPQFCGKCHSDLEYMRAFRPMVQTDQVTQYYTSVHGQKLKKGDLKVADCTGCHSVHNIMPAEDPRSTVYHFNLPQTCNSCHGDAEYMKNYNIPTTQYEEYVGSVHGKALFENQDTGAPACNDCHGNHGATPPGVSSISHVCGTCHVNNMRYFATTRMAAAFTEQQLHACEECHGNHAVQKTSDKMLGAGDESVCVDCHAEGEEGYQVGVEMRSMLEELVSRFDTAQVAYKNVQRVGMNDIDIGFVLQESKQKLIQSRTLVHSFDKALIAEKTTEGIQLADNATKMAEKEIEDYYVRRRGFGIATIFITLLVAALFLKIRDVEK